MKTEEEVEKKVTEITDLINSLVDDPEISEESNKDSAVRIAGFAMYLTCPEMSDFDKMMMVIKKVYLEIKSKRG